MDAVDADLHRWLAFAGWAGAHATPLFAAALVALVALTLGLWWSAHRWGERAAASGAPRPLPVVVRAAAGAAAVLGAAALFAEIVEELDANGPLGRIDEAFTAALLAHVPLATVRVFAVVTDLGDPVFLTGLVAVVAIALLATRRIALAAGWLAATAGNGILNQALKQIFARARPVHADGLVQAEGYSFPSGHTSGSLVVYGMLAYIALQVLPKRWHAPALAIAVALAFAIGSSRAFLRVHFASDVLAGFATGTLWLAICIASVELARWHRGRRNPSAA
ncbi:MAG TPA: phosphatase PAP2 family protein [Geminicoccaceae bacterium]